MLARFVCVFAIVAAFGLLSPVSADTAHPHHSRSHTVTIESGTLPEAKAFAPLRLGAGEWVYNFNPGEEALFFEPEDAGNRQWQQWKADLRLLQASQEKQRLRNYPAGGEKTDTPDRPANTERQEPGALPIAEYFSDRNVQRRYTERLKEQSLHNVSDAQGAADALVLVEGEIAAMWHLVRLAGSSDSLNDQQFLGLVERHFSHTIANASAAAADATSSSFPFALLRVPLVLEAEVLPFMEREVAHVRELWKSRRAGAATPAVSSVAAESQLQLLSSAVENSKTVGAEVAALAEPLADAAISWVASTLATTREAIVANDESTEAKRSELKQLLKMQSRLRKVRPILEKHSKVYQSVLQRGQLPNAEATLFALQLIVKQRLGNDVSGLVEAVPLLSTTAPLTGLLEQEWRAHVLAPYGMCVLVTAAFVWVCEDIKERFMTRVRARRLCMPLGMPALASGCTRQILMLVSLLELVVPPLLPVIALAVHLRGARVWVWGMIALMRPSQRAVCLASVSFLMFSAHLVATMVQRVFQIIHPSVYRRRLAKKK
ncbi:conserved hypothetical protein [Leishmania major strain Friedlin]|uniref:Uncharacterized protein n=1 Tax=Leishmania major TaxID=5664 RepID=Q4Q1X4_LEIMA|nr:conserved hypothetical protein [Leishmania major strain Friedlin]CAG9583620.1 hypothetical_protein_-_conserved [Leishmania major strain Friedlin]CAJ09055.1 conserved hypothetical protein [Leishmania major strain Friedlin]|eukprot:XP_001686674.1 conserved hypothetical protein [Leishmania major strain Friedlin]